MEETTKSIEKCHYAINRQREICDGTDASGEGLAAASLCFREALMNAEMLWLSKMDPVTKRWYLKKSDNVHQIFSNIDSTQTNKEIITLIEHSFKPDEPPKKENGFFLLQKKKILTQMLNLKMKDWMEVNPMVS